MAKKTKVAPEENQGIQVTFTIPPHIMNVVVKKYLRDLHNGQISSIDDCIEACQIVDDAQILVEDLFHDALVAAVEEFVG